MGVEARLLLTGFLLVAASTAGWTDIGRRRSHDLLARAVSFWFGATVIWAAKDQSASVFEYGTAPALFAASLIACLRSKGAFVWVMVSMFCFVWLMYVFASGAIDLNYNYG